MSYKRIEELVILGKQGDKNALDELISTYEKLIRKYTTNYFIKGYDEEDLEQIAKMAVIQAVEKYDISKGANFTGFVDIVIRNTFITMINKKENSVNTVSLNKIVYDDGEDFKEYMDILIDDTNIEENFEYKEQKLELLKALNRLSQEDREILTSTYGEYGGLKEYAKRKGKTYASCRYKRDRALEKVKGILRR